MCLETARDGLVDMFCSRGCRARARRASRAVEIVADYRDDGVGGAGTAGGL